jgi:hypothetical protein
MPPNIVATGGWRIRLTAVDPTTGADVTGVVVSNASIAVRDIGGNQGEPAPLPGLVPVSNEV